MSTWRDKLMIPLVVTIVGGIIVGLVLWVVESGPTTQQPSPHPTALGGSQTGSVRPASTGVPAGTVLIRQKGVQLTSEHELSFSDPTLHPSSSSCSGDLYVCGFIYVGSSAQLAQYSGTPQPAGFSQCQSDTNYVSGGGQDLGQSLVGTTLCITTANRIAACYITGDTRHGTGPTYGLTMDVTVYSWH